MKGQRLYKYEKLCSRTAIDGIFNGGDSAVSYPVRAVFRIIPATETPAKFMITVPKKKIRTAVGRVLMRRRVREAYRLNRELLLPALAESGMSVEIAFIYLDSRFVEYAVLENKMKTLLEKIAAAVKSKVGLTSES